MSEHVERATETMMRKMRSRRNDNDDDNDDYDSNDDPWLRLVA